MSLMNYGYKKEEIQIRKMTMAELRLGIVQELLKKNYRYVNIRLVNTTCGDVDSYRSTEDFLMAGYNEGYEIELIQVKEVLYYEESEKCSKIRIVILINAVFAVLVILGVVTDPTTKGITDSDQALTYTEPKK